MKLVRENLNEISQGKHTGLGSIGIGKITLIKKWLQEKYINNYVINLDSTIDIKGDLEFVRLAHENLCSPKIESFPDYIQFGTVQGRFDISGCSMLHLNGCPISVEKTFDCSNNELDSLDFCPKFVGGEFVCYGNFRNFNISYVKKCCEVKQGIYVDETKYYEDSIEYDRMIRMSENE